MSADRFYDFWMDYVLFCGITFAHWVIDKASEALGLYAGFVVYAITFPITLALLAFGLFSTGVLIVAAVVMSPLILPVTIYLHMKDGRRRPA